MTNTGHACIPDSLPVTRQNDGPLRACSVRLFLTATASFNSRVCAHVTGGPQTHIGIIFDMENGKSVYMEAMFRKGVVPARSTEKLELFLLKAVGRNKLWIAETNIKGDAANMLYKRCQEDVGEYGYYEWQLVLMWFNERIGRFIRWSMPTSEHLVVCSEWVSRRIARYGYDLRDFWHRSHDAVTPHSAYKKMGLENKSKFIAAPRRIQAGELI